MGGAMMAEWVLCSGNEAAARGAIQAGCKYFFGYPITPQNEIAEFMAEELPKIGGVYLQSDGETAASYMLFGGALTGKRVMTATSSPGFSLMQEAISHMATVEAPAVIVQVMRLGPGAGTGGQQGQTDYRQMTKGGGHGAYRNIVLAPYSVQEIFDFTQMAFYLADKYRILVLVATDFILGRMTERLHLRTIDFPPLPDKDWALKGKDQKGGKSDHHMSALVFGGIPEFFQRQREKYQQIIESETRFETYQTENARVIIVAYGSTARLARRAVNLARENGLAVGLFRPVTLWPFPKQPIKEVALQAEKILVVEDSPGELIEDVESAVAEQVPVYLLGIWARHHSGPSGLIYPERIFQEIKALI
jgi:2-oxoglutarate ferredoxin oxidoreductase subunit alpha